MRVTTWNIRGGGGVRCSAIAERLKEESPDLCVLSEYRTRPGEKLRGALGLADSRYFCETEPPLNQNGLLVYSSREVVSRTCPANAIPASSHRWLTANLPRYQMDVLGVHIPNQCERWNKTDFWTQVLAFATRHLNQRALIIGDFNTGLELDMGAGRCIHEEQFRTLTVLRWVDAWRAIHGDRCEYTWYSPNKGTGFRLDHCFLSPSLGSFLSGAYFNHEVRKEGLSDHSMLSVDLSICD